MLITWGNFKAAWNDAVGSKLCQTIIVTIVMCMIDPDGTVQFKILTFIRQYSLYIIVLLMGYIIYSAYANHKLQTSFNEKNINANETKSISTDIIEARVEAKIADMITKTSSPKIEINLDLFIKEYTARLTQLNQEYIIEEKLAADHNLISPYREEHKNAANRIKAHIQTEHNELKSQIELLSKLKS